MSRIWIGFFLAASFAACSNTPAPPPGDAGPVCDDSKCKMGNRCISDGKTLTCRIPCTSNEPSNMGACPFNFHCVAASAPNTNTSGESANYCVKDAKVITPKATGQWGAPCDPTKGFDNNADCDVAQGFTCYGISPSDGQAFCTQHDCASDDECRMGYWCATINGTPNVTSTTRTFGADQVRSVCLPRALTLDPGSYTAPCTSDLDCPLNQGQRQRCIDPGDGIHSVCAVVCAVKGNCTLETACADVGLVDKDGAPQLVCAPKAGTFGPLGEKEKGTGVLCTPCHSDVDCTDGVCILAEKATERFCTQKSAIPCTMSASMCPMAPAGAAVGGVGCITSSSTMLAPKDQCIGQVIFGAGVKVPGCWTSAR